MKILSCFFALAAGLVLAGCTQLAMGPVPDPNRVVTGTIVFTEPAALPADTQIVVRVLDTSRVEGLSKIIDEQTFKGGGASPISYKIEFHAEDAMLQRGLSIEARVSYDGKVQLFNANSYAITSENLNAPHEIAVEKISR